MARTFLTTDKLATPSVTVLTGAMTICFWGKGPDGTSGRAWTHNTNNIVRMTSTTTIRLQRDFDTTDSVWSCTTANHGMNLANWNHFAWVHDGTIAAPLFYANAVSKTVTVTTAPVGSPLAGTSAMQIGNNNGGTVPWAGQIAYFALYDVQLGPGEILEQMMTGQVNGRTPYIAYRLDASAPAIDLSRSNQIAAYTGSQVTDDPPMRTPFVPWRRRLALPAAAAPATSTGFMTTNTRFWGP